MSELYTQAKRVRGARNNENVISRVFFDILLLVGVFLAPWWVLFILSFFGMAYFNRYYESIVAGILFDLLYNLPVQIAGIFAFQYFFGAAFLVLYFAVAAMKNKIR